ncbi:MAG TPA: hypothetical protein VGO70_10800 [Arsenicitalea sp.]|jgi:hypothetical protein|nr:hypothetical protein [Arsenicitalea sp.]
MLKIMLSTSAFLLALVPASFAGGTTFGGFAEIAASGQYPTANPAPLPPGSVGSIKAGAMEIIFESTNLTDIQKTFGGALHDQGEAGGHIIWICYGGGEATMWFYSDSEMAHGTVSLVAVENRSPLAEWGCAAAPTGLTALDFGLPGPGAPLSDITARYGSSPSDSNGRFSYSGDTPLGDGSESVKFQELVFEAHDGVITAVAASQETID